MLKFYKAYALTICSDVTLDLPAGEAKRSPDILIRHRDIGGGENGQLPYKTNSGDTIIGHIYDEIHFLVKEGELMYYDVLKPIPDGALQSYLLGVLMATLLRQRGFLVLHACSVAKDGKAVAFIGESGWGKSTLAEYFYQSGYTLLSDDVLAIRVEEGGRPHVIPGYPQIRLREEAGRHLRKDFDGLPRVNEKTKKRFTTPDRFPDCSLPLHKLYLLDPGFTAENAVEPVPAQHALLRLIQHARATNLLKAPAFQTELFRQCEQLVQQVPVKRLRRVKDLNRLSEIRELVEQDLSQGEKGAASAAEICRVA